MQLTVRTVLLCDVSKWRDNCSSYVGRFSCIGPLYWAGLIEPLASLTHCEVFLFYFKCWSLSIMHEYIVDTLQYLRSTFYDVLIVMFGFTFLVNIVIWLFILVLMIYFWISLLKTNGVERHPNPRMALNVPLITIPKQWIISKYWSIHYSFTHLSSNIDIFPYVNIWVKIMPPICWIYTILTQNRKQEKTGLTTYTVHNITHRLMVLRVLPLIWRYKYPICYLCTTFVSAKVHSVFM